MSLFSLKNSPALAALAMMLAIAPTDMAVADTTAAQPSIAVDLCASLPPFDFSMAAPFIEMVLTPGQGIDLSKFTPDQLTQMAAFQKEAAARQALDWANLCRYADDNRRVIASAVPQRAVFLGDSITDYWQFADPSYFGTDVQNRGISGQTTAQMLLRFYPDVIALKPRVVHIMAGTNDVAGNLGLVSDDTIIANISAMIDMADAHGIKVVIASIPPAQFMSWKPGLSPAPRILLLNQRLAELAQSRGAVYLDYHSRLRDDKDGLPLTFANDGVHPNRDAYAIMKPMANDAIALAAAKED